MIDDVVDARSNLREDGTGVRSGTRVVELDSGWVLGEFKIYFGSDKPCARELAYREGLLPVRPQSG